MVLSLDGLVEENFDLVVPKVNYTSGLILKGNAFTAIGHKQGPNKFLSITFSVT